MYTRTQYSFWSVRHSCSSCDPVYVYMKSNYEAPFPTLVDASYKTLCPSWLHSVLQRQSCLFWIWLLPRLLVVSILARLGVLRRCYDRLQHCSLSEKRQDLPMDSAQLWWPSRRYGLFGKQANWLGRLLLWRNIQFLESAFRQWPLQWNW